MTPSTPKTQILLISGRAGSGKTSLAYEIATKLRRQKHPFIHIEADNLDNSHPDEPGSELFLLNLHDMWRNCYTLRGIRTLVLAGTGVVLEHEAIKRTVEEVCGELACLEAVVLTTSDETATSRLTRREVGSELPDLLASSWKMERELATFDGGIAVHRYSTEDWTICDLADEVIRRTIRRDG